MSKISELTWTPPFVVRRGDGSIEAVGTTHSYRLPLSETWELLDLQDCMSDLDSVTAIGSAIEAQLADSDFNFDLFKALIITYCRGFASGKSRAPGESRFNLRSFEELLTHEQRQKHDEILDIRNKQVAHSVDSGSAMVTVHFAVDGSFEDMGSVHVGMPAGMNQVRETVALAKTFHDFASDKREELMALLRQQLSGMSLTPEQLRNAENAYALYVKQMGG